MNGQVDDLQGKSERGEGARGGDPRPEPQRETDACRGCGRVAGMPGQHRTEDGDAEHGGELAHGSCGPRRLALLGGRDRGSRAAATGAKKRPDPAPITTSAGTRAGYEPDPATCAVHARPDATIAAPVASTGRAPKRSPRRPPTGASSIGMTAIGNSRSPACHGDAAQVVWNSCAMRNTPPNSAAYIPTDARVAAVNARLRKKRRAASAPALGVAPRRTAPAAPRRRGPRPRRRCAPLRRPPG